MIQLEEGGPQMTRCKRCMEREGGCKHCNKGYVLALPPTNQELAALTEGVKDFLKPELPEMFF